MPLVSKWQLDLIELTSPPGFRMKFSIWFFNDLVSTALAVDPIAMELGSDSVVPHILHMGVVPERHLVTSTRFLFPHLEQTLILI
jgi:hypothetical protein